MTDHRRPGKYVAEGFFLLRVPLLPTYIGVAASNGFTGQEELLADVVERTAVKNALAISAPNFAIRSALDLNRTKSAAAARYLKTLNRYITRMSTRPTPFGALASTSLHDFGDGDSLSATIADADNLLVHARPDSGLAYAVAEARSADASALFRWNVSAHEGGRKILLPDNSVFGSSTRQAIRVDATGPAGRARELARTEIRLRDLISALAAEYPQTSPDRIESFVKSLQDQGLLLPVDLPESLVNKPHFSGATGLPSAPTRLDQFDPGEARQSLSALAKDLDIETLDVRSTHAASTNVPASVGADLADAADFLLQICRGAGDALEEYDRYLDTYRNEFLERFGVDTAVPISKSVDPVLGIGLPGHFEVKQAPPHTRGPALSRYERLLLDLATEAWQTGSNHLIVTPDIEQRLRAAAPVSSGYRSTQPSLDVFAQVLATPNSDGGWQAVLNSVPVGLGGASFGRFMHDLDEAGRDKIAALIRRRVPNPETILGADLAFVPAQARVANVTVRPLVHDHHVGINVPSVSGSEEIALPDVHLVATYERLYLWSARHKRELHISAHHLLSLEAAPPVARLMVEVSERRYAAPGGFSWGPLEGSLRLPRVVRKNVVLRVAEWTVPRSMIDVEEENVVDWLPRHRERWDIPSQVYLTSQDQRLLIDCESDRGMQEIEDALAQSGQVRLQEVYPPLEPAWVRDVQGHGYVGEIVVPVVARDVSYPATPDPQPLICDPPVVEHRSELWTYCKLYTEPTLQDEILHRDLPRLLQSREPAAFEKWFFIRYSDPAHHLRLRFRSSSEDDRWAMQRRLDGWASELKRAGMIKDFVFAQYSPELARYGGADSMALVERVFELSSQQAAAMARASPDSRLLQAVATADKLAAAWGYSAADRRGLASDYPAEAHTTDAARVFVRLHQSELLDSLDTADAEPDELRDLLRQLRSKVDLSRDNGEFAPNNDSVIRSIIHMNFNRMLSTEHTEALAHKVWQDGWRALSSRRAARR
jgi:thiopeptide-type bacteriocin biosynthesis protein